MTARPLAIVFAGSLATVLAMPAAAQIRGDSDKLGHPPGAAGKTVGRDASKGKTGTGSGLMEEEGIFYFKKQPPARDHSKGK